MARRSHGAGCMACNWHGDASLLLGSPLVIGLHRPSVSLCCAWAMYAYRYVLCPACKMLTVLPLWLWSLPSGWRRERPRRLLLGPKRDHHVGQARRRQPEPRGEKSRRERKLLGEMRMRTLSGESKSINIVSCSSLLLVFVLLKKGYGHTPRHRYAPRTQ